MRRALNSLGRYAAGLSRAWNDFWYTPADPSLLGLIRILTGMMLIYTHAVWGLALNDFFGPKAWISRKLVELVQQDQYAYSFWWWVPPGWIWPAYALVMLILICFTIGLWARVSAILAFVVVISFANRVPEALLGLDKINIMLTIYLAVGPSGRALSVDRLLALRRAKGPAPVEASVGANFAIRLIQLHMCIIYFFAGISKFQGAAWWTGEAMWMVFANQEYQSIDMTWLAWHPWLVEVLSHFTALWELSFCALIWVPLLRPLVLAGAVVLHLGIGATMGLWTFSLIMLVGCASFLPPDGVRSLLDMLATGRERKGAPENRSGVRT
jgi:vitamin K-dependent gamma-carboxylase-like protein